MPQEADTSTMDDANKTASDVRDAVKPLADMVTANPMPSVLAAAATGAGLMALIALMMRPRSVSLPKPSMPSTVSSYDVDSLKDQISDLVKRFSSALPSKGDAKDAAKQGMDTAKSAAKSLDSAKETAKQNLDDASDSAQETWNTIRDQAADVLDKWQPQINAATQAARDNPLWAAVIAGALGTLIGSQFFGKSTSSGPLAD